jgi:hypothetical protein
MNLRRLERLRLLASGAALVSGTASAAGEASPIQTPDVHVNAPAPRDDAGAPKAAPEPPKGKSAKGKPSTGA